MTTASVKWDLLRSGPVDDGPTVLLVAGSLATAAFYADVLAEPSLAAVRLVAATLPGQGGTPPAAPRLIQRHIRLYLNYLDRHGSVARRLCDSGARTWVVYGEHDEVGLTDTERAILDDCPTTTVRTIAGAGHLIPNTHPEVVAALIIQALRERPGQQPHIATTHPS